MSQAQERQRETSGGRESPYPRDNYFASVDGEYDTEREITEPPKHKYDHSDHSQKRGITKDEWIVRSLQHDRATFLCPIALHDDPEDELNLHDVNQEVVLSDPAVYPPDERSMIEQTDAQLKSPSTHRWRVNEEHGYIVFGGVVKDVPRPQLLAFIDEIVAAIHAEPLDREIGAAKDLADELKRTGDFRDVDILSQVVAQLLNGGGQTSSQSG